MNGNIDDYEFYSDIPDSEKELYDKGKIYLSDGIKYFLGGIFDGIGEGIENFHKSISPNEREKKNLNEELKNMKVEDYQSLQEVIQKEGENEKLISLCSIHTGNEKIVDYLGCLYNNVQENTIKIDECREILKDYGIRLDNNDIRITNCEFRLDKVEKGLQIHDILIANQGRKIRKLEVGFSIHEKRLNQQDRIIAYHSNIIQQQNKILNYHSNLIKNLSTRMLKSEQDIYNLSQELNIHRKILGNQEEMIKMNQQNIQELFKITNYHQMQLSINDENIRLHQKAIIDCRYNLNYLKNRIENDEKIIINLGETISKVINYATNTQNIVDGLSYATQLHDNLIIQNHNDIIELKKEINNQWDYIISQNEILKEVIEEVKNQGIILRLHGEKIKNLENYCEKFEKDIKKINEIIPQLKGEISEVKNDFEEFKKKYKLERNAKKIDDRIKILNKTIANFNETQQGYFIKCIYISMCTGNYNLKKMEEIAKNILLYGV